MKPELWKKPFVIDSDSTSGYVVQAWEAQPDGLWELVKLNYPDAPSFSALDREAFLAGLEGYLDEEDLARVRPALSAPGAYEALRGFYRGKMRAIQAEWERQHPARP